MRKLLLACVVAMAAVSLLQADDKEPGPPLPADPDDGLLQNGGFEESDKDGQPKGWSKGPRELDPGAPVRFETTVAGPATGKFCGMVMMGGGVMIVEQTVDLSQHKGKMLRFTGRLRVSQEFSGKIDLFIAEDATVTREDDPGVSFENGGSTSVEPDNTEWQEFSIDMLVPAEGKAVLGVAIVSKGRATIKMDGFALAEVPEEK